MARLIYSVIASLDGHVADGDGRFDWAAPDEEVHRFVNELERPVGTYLYGRRMYETMVFWESAPELAEQPPSFLVPVVVGGGKRSLPENVRVNLELLDQRRFRSGTVHLHHRTRK